MISYTDLSCPVCHQPFKAEDDVVVCPVCGAPHHRECYRKEGHCAYADTHGTEEQWQRPQPQGEEPDEDDPLAGVCPRCGYKNPPGTLFCVKCSLSLKDGNPSTRFNGEPPPPPRPQPGDQPFSPFGPIMLDPYGGVDPGHSIGGIPVPEIASFVGENASYYLPRFYQMQKNKSPISLNFAAGLLDRFWVLFRRMSGFFALLFAVTTLLSLPSTIIYAQYTIALASGAQTFEPSQTLAILSTVFSYVSLAVRLLLLVFSNRLYMAYVLRSIKRIRARGLDPLAYQEALMKKGGTKAVNILIVIGLNVAVAGVLALLLLYVF